MLHYSILEKGPIYACGHSSEMTQLPLDIQTICYDFHLNLTKKIRLEYKFFNKKINN